MAAQERELEPVFLYTQPYKHADDMTSFGYRDGVWFAKWAVWRRGECGMLFNAPCHSSSASPSHFELVHSIYLVKSEQKAHAYGPGCATHGHVCQP